MEVTASVGSQQRALTPAHAGGVEAMIDRTGAEWFDPKDGNTILGTEFRLNCP